MLVKGYLNATMRAATCKKANYRVTSMGICSDAETRLKRWSTIDGVPYTSTTYCLTKLKHKKSNK